MYVFVKSTGGTYTTFLPNPVREITRVDLVSARIPITTSSVYYHLDIQELRSSSGIQIAGTSNASTKYFASVCSNVYDERDYTSSVVFKNPIEKLDRLTVKWVNVPDGFGDHSFLLRFYEAEPKKVFSWFPVGSVKSTSGGQEYIVMSVFVSIVLSIVIVTLFSGSLRRPAAAA